MKSILMSIQPKWVEKIINGEKTIEVRKTAPKEVPFKVYIYCTEGGQILREAFYPNGKPDKKYFYLADRNRNHEKNLNGKVIGEFICDKVDKVINHGSGFSIFNESEAYTNCVAKQSGLYFDDLKKYLETKDGYAWHITDLKLYDNPRELGEFRRKCKYNHKCGSCKHFNISSKISPYSLPYCDIRYIERPPQSYMEIEDPEEN